MKKALELDNTLAEVYVILGNINRLYDWDWKAAEKNFIKALQLNPNSADNHMWYAFLLAFTERFEEAIIEAKRAQELDPLSSWINTHKAFIYSIAGQYDRAIEELQMSLVMAPDYWLAHLGLGLAYVGKFMIEEAIVEYEKASDLSNDDPYAMAFLANNYYETGQKIKADSILDILKQRSRGEYIPPMCFCWIYQTRGEMDLYYEWLEQACNEHDGFLPWFRVISIERYRIPDEPRYNELLEKAGLLKHQ